MGAFEKLNATRNRANTHTRVLPISNWPQNPPKYSSIQSNTGVLDPSIGL